MRRNRRTGQPIVPTYRISGDSSLASTHLPAAREYLIQANRVFGQHMSFSTTTTLQDGTSIKAVKAGRQFLLFVDAPIVEAFSPVFEGLLTLMVVPRYDHTKGLTLSPINNLLYSTGQNRGILGHHSIGQLFKDPATIPNDKFKKFVTPPLNTADISLTNTNYRQKIFRSVINYNTTVRDPANENYNWAYKRQIELTRDYTITESSDIPQYTSQTGDPDLPPPQINENSEAFAKLGAVRTGNIDWRSLAGEIYSIKGPSGRGVPATISGMTTAMVSDDLSAIGDTSQYDLYVRSGRLQGAARVDAFGRRIYKGGKVLVNVPVGRVVIGVCTRQFVNADTGVLENFLIAATSNPDFLHSAIEFRRGLSGLFFLSQLISPDLSTEGWTQIGVSGGYNHNYPFFFSSSGNKGISTYNDHRYESGPDYHFNTGKEPIHFETYSTIRTTFVNPLNISITVERHDPVVFPTTRSGSQVAFAGERIWGKHYFPTSELWHAFYRPYASNHYENTTPEVEIATRISSDFKYQTEQEVYVEKRIKFKASSISDGFSESFGGAGRPGGIRTETSTSEPEDPVPLHEIISSQYEASAVLTISYYQSFVGEFEADPSLSDLTDSSIGLTCDPSSITPAPPQGTGSLQKIGEVISTYDNTVINGVGAFGDLRDGEMQMTACDLRFGLAIYNISINDYTPHVIEEPIYSGSNQLRPVITGSDFYGWMICPGRFTKELPDITSDIVQEGDDPTSVSMHVGNQSYFNTVGNSTQYLTGLITDMAKYSGYLSYDGGGLTSADTGNFLYDYTPHGYDGMVVSWNNPFTDLTPTLNPSILPRSSYLAIDPAVEHYLPLFPTGSSRLDISGLYAGGQQLTYAIVGIDREHYAVFTPWLEHLPGYDKDPSNDILDPNSGIGGPKTNDSDIWQAAGAPQIPHPTANDKALLGLDGDFLTEEYYKNLTIYRGIKEDKVALGMKRYEDADPIQIIT